MHSVNAELQKWMRPVEGKLEQGKKRARRSKEKNDAVEEKRAKFQKTVDNQ